ncbi:zinc finger protein [Musa troglodytarum]|uniref:Zinc finger protein n=1 Tax=Musa troglodytarum TaxID=320322 RepID=A0A9E7JIX3_9LILI|nr:zinc finger protein [Musa troglodytarum]
MEISNARHQAMGSHGLEEAVACPKTQQQQDRKARPHPEHALPCPRNVPVGGGCRKTKRSSSSSSKKANPHLIPPPLSHDPSDDRMSLQKLLPMKQFGSDRENDHSFLVGNTNTDPFSFLANDSDPMPSAPTPTKGFLDYLRNGLVDISSPSSFSNIDYDYGLGANGGCGMPTGVGLSGATAGTTTCQGSCKAMGGGWPRRDESSMAGWSHGFRKRLLLEWRRSFLAGTNQWLLAVRCNIYG